MLDTFASISVCVAYTLDGHTLSTPPTSESLKRVKCVYDAAGWQSITSSAHTFADLPLMAQRYVHRIQARDEHVRDATRGTVAGGDGSFPRCVDRVAGLLILILLAPVMLATAIAVKLDSSGPVFFRQRRLGFNNEVIEIFKFRSLYHEHADPNARRVVTKDDSRVTRVGRFIRRTSIDELPQLFNVLRGELSLVGPRPHAVEAPTANRLWEEVVDSYFARHRVRPGLTGWAQINGWRGELDTPEKLEKRVEHDLYYIENWSLGFDLYILLRTPFALLHSENAY